ncbi:MAG: hypothetical protein H6832_02915 [Planctomycetes bacterium]|nr:hypothetical protein [Planctomycetota bacterium]
MTSRIDGMSPSLPPENRGDSISNERPKESFFTTSQASPADGASAARDVARSKAEQGVTRASQVIQACAARGDDLQTTLENFVEHEVRQCLGPRASPSVIEAVSNAFSEAPELRGLFEQIHQRARRSE